jgi:hypothetical protein
MTHAVGYDADAQLGERRKDRGLRAAADEGVLGAQTSM